MPIPRPALFAGEGKVGLFKSLRNLKGSDLRYAIGYNMSTLRMLGVPLAGLVSLPYDIQQTMNTFKRFSQTATTGSLLPGAKRIGVLSYARNIVPKARGALPKSNIGAIDRYTSLYFGRQSRQVIKQINKGGGKKAAMKAFFDPAVVDREIQKQAKRPTQQNVLHNWQMATYMRAVTGAPDPIRNNPFMQAKNYMAKSKNTRKVQPFNLDARYRIVDSKGEHLLMQNDRFEQVMGGLEAGAFTNPEAHIKAVMDQQMMNYMMETIDRDSNYLRTNLTRNAKAAHKSRRSNYLQGLYAKSGLEVSRDIGNSYNLGQGNPNISEVRNNKTGQLRGYSTSELADFQKNQVMSSVIPALESESRFRTAMEGGMVNPEFASLVNNLSVELGFSSQNMGRMNAKFTTGQLINALGNIGISMSLDPKDFSKSARTATLNFNNQIKSVINFTREVDRLGMTSLSDALSGMLVSSGALAELGKSKSLDALEFALSDNALTNDIVQMVGPKGEAFFRSKDMVQGELVKVRQAANNEVQEMLLGGGNMRTDKTGNKIGNYFYSPHMKSGGMGIVESSLHFYYDNERDSNNPRYYRSYQSLKYAENRKKKAARGGYKQFGNDDKYFTEGNKAYKIQEIPDMIHIKSDKFPDRTITMINGSVQHRIKDVTETLRNYSNMNNGVGLGNAQISMHYELAMLMHIEQQLKKGARAFSFTKSKMSRYAEEEKLDMHFVAKHERVAEADKITGFEHASAARVLQARPDKGHEFATSLMEGQQIPQHLMGWNKGGNSYLKGVTVSNEAQRRAESRRERKTTGNNFIPSKMDIASSIHMIPLASKEARKGPGMLNAVVVAGVSAAKRGRKADKVRDIVAIEYGGPATDAQGGLSSRTDGMFYLPSYFFTRAATESAAFLGLEAGNILKNKEKALGRDMTLSIKESDPNRKRARMQARKKDRALREIRKGQRNMRRAQNAFIGMQRKFARKSNDEMMRALNRRGMKAFNDAERVDGLNAPKGNDRFIDPEFLLEDSSDRFLREGLAGMGAREFRMNSLGIVKRRIGQAGLGGGFIKNPSTGKITEITPSQYANVYEVDGQSMVGRLPYMPVFDEQIYRRLLRTNSFEARRYLKNTRTRLGKFSPEYTQNMGDLLNNSEFMMQGLLGVQNFNTLKALIGTRASDVRKGIAQAVGLNRIDIPDYQMMVANPQGPNSEIGFIRETLAGGKAKSNLTALYLQEMETSLRDILTKLPNAERQIIMNKIRLQAASTASKVANAIQTVWGRTSSGGVFGTAGDLFNALERTSILLEQGFAATTDTTGLLGAAYNMARSQQEKLKITRELLDTNKSRFIITNMNTGRTIEKIMDSDVQIEISERGLSDVIQDEIEKDNKIYDQEINDDFLPNQTRELRYDSENVSVDGRGVMNITPQANIDEAIKEMQELIFQDDTKFQGTQEIARQLSYKFSFSTKEGIYAEKLMEYYERQGIFPEINNIGAIDGRSRDGSGVNVHNARKKGYNEKFRNNKGEFSNDIGALARFTENAISRTLTPEQLAADLFKDDLHLFVDPENSLYDDFKRSRVSSGHTELHGIDFQYFEGIVGAYFYKADYQESKRFIIALVDEARKGKDGPVRSNKQVFAEKFFLRASSNLQHFYAAFHGKTAIDDSNDMFYTIINHYKNQRNRNLR